jgi:predicted DNA-binding transcriptional regulator AlpA
MGGRGKVAATVTPDHLRLAVAADHVEPLEPLLTAAEVGRILSVRPKRVYELGIPAVRISERSLRWSRSDLEAWITERKGVA